MKPLTFAELAARAKELWPDDWAQRKILQRTVRHLEAVDPNLHPNSLVGFIHLAQFERVFAESVAIGLDSAQTAAMRDVENLIAGAIGRQREKEPLWQ